MPFIHIKSLPFAIPFEVSGVSVDIGRVFAKGNDIPRDHVHTTWEFSDRAILPGVIVITQYQPDDPHSLLVDLLTPDFNS